MAKVTIRATIKVAWWWAYYSACVRFMADVTGMQPNPERVHYWASKATTIKMGEVKRINGK